MRSSVVCLKVVNFAPFAILSKINIAGMATLQPKAKTVLLTGDNLKLENTADQPNRVVPVEGSLNAIAPEFTHVFPRFRTQLLR